METININELKKSIISASNNLSNNKSMVNDLNVYPVPDGDTGTNMNMTIKSALENALNKDSHTIKGFLNDFSRGSLLGARGNSGVILSQLIRGFVDPIDENAEYLNIDSLVKSFSKASEVAYNAVMKPTEGTILTVSKDIAKAANRYPKNNSNMLDFLEYVLKYGKESLENTPNLLPVLKESGVVDAGGMGLICLIEGAYKYLAGEETTLLDETDIIKTGVSHIQTSTAEVEHGYCTEFIILLGNEVDPSETERELKDKLGKIGDSMLVIAADDVVKVHVHTLNPGKALEYAVQYGSLNKIKIDNMSIQHQEIIFEKEMYEKAEAGCLNKEKVKNGLIAVSVGEGFDEIFESLNVSKIIKGGQTMNPSTEDILSAVEDLNAENIFILPNNKNIILSAEQVIDMTDKNVYVVPTKSIPEGITAILNIDDSLSPEDILSNIDEALENIKIGEVTFSVRGTKFNGQDIKEGETLGLYDKGIVSKGSSIKDVTKDLISKMIDDEDYLVSIYSGTDVDEAEANNLVSELEDMYPDVDIELVYGGQPLYYYIISIE